MTRLLLYEDLTSGLWQAESPQHPVSRQLLAEGRAMLAALAADAAELPHVQTTVVVAERDSGPWPPGVRRLAPPATAQADGVGWLADQAARADFTVLIAPEIEGRLTRLASAIEAAGGRLLGPSAEKIARFSDKQHSVEFWNARWAAQVGLPAVEALPLDGPISAWGPPPWVLKPNDGCGSTETFLIDRPEQIDAYRKSAPATPWRLEPYMPGVAASVAVLAGPQGLVPLLPGEQHIERVDGQFHYRGGRLPLASPRRERLAGYLARLAGVWQRPPHGYWGLDVILGDAEDGSGDRLLEINPRLTTSYLGLQAMLDPAVGPGGLLAAMLSVARGDSPNLAWRPGGVVFSTQGHISREP